MDVLLSLTQTDEVFLVSARDHVTGKCRLEYVSPNAETVLGASAADLMGRNTHELLVLDGISAEELSTWEMHIEDKFVKCVGEPVPVKWRKGGTLFLTHMWDGKRRRWYSRLSKPAKHENLADMLYDLLMRSSHDMRTPLNSIFMASQMLLRSEPAEHVAVLSIVESLGRRCSFLLAIVQSILELQKLETNAMVLNAVQTDPREVILDAVEVCEETCGGQEAGPMIVVRLAEMPEAVEVDGARLSLLLMILFATAIKLGRHCQQKAASRAASAAADSETDFQFESDGTFRSPHSEAMMGPGDDDSFQLFLCASYVTPDAPPPAHAPAAHAQPRFPGVALHIDLPGVSLEDWQSPDGILGGPWEPSSVLTQVKTSLLVINGLSAAMGERLTITEVSVSGRPCLRFALVVRAPLYQDPDTVQPLPLPPPPPPVSAAAPDGAGGAGGGSMPRGLSSALPSARSAGGRKQHPFAAAIAGQQGRAPAAASAAAAAAASASAGAGGADAPCLSAGGSVAESRSVSFPPHMPSSTTAACSAPANAAPGAPYPNTGLHLPPGGQSVAFVQSIAPDGAATRQWAVVGASSAAAQQQQQQQQQQDAADGPSDNHEALEWATDGAQPPARPNLARTASGSSQSALGLPRPTGSLASAATSSSAADSQPLEKEVSAALPLVPKLFRTRGSASVADRLGERLLPFTGVPWGAESDGSGSDRGSDTGEGGDGAQAQGADAHSGAPKPTPTPTRAPAPASATVSASPPGGIGSTTAPPSFVSALADAILAESKQMYAVAEARSGHIVYVSPFSERLLGRKAAEILGRPMSAFLHARHAQHGAHGDGGPPMWRERAAPQAAPLDSFAAAAAGTTPPAPAPAPPLPPAPAHEHYALFTRGDGTPFWGHVLSVTRDGFVLCTVRDVTETLQTQASLQQLLLAISIDMSGVLVDIQESARTLRGFPEVAADEEASFLTGCIDHSSRMLQALATNVLLAQRAQQQHTGPAESSGGAGGGGGGAFQSGGGGGPSGMTHGRQPRRVNVGRMMDALIDMCSLSCAHRTSITWEWLGEALQSSVVVDEQSLVQIVMNFVTNAVKFCDGSDVKATVRATPLDPPVVGETGAAAAVTLEIGVEDGGRGMTKEQTETMFEPYERCTTEQGGGTGLGLHIAKTLAQSMGGSVSVASELGKGSRFVVTVPVPTAPQQQPPAAAHAVQQPPGGLSSVGEAPARDSSFSSSEARGGGGGGGGDAFVGSPPRATSSSGGDASNSGHLMQMLGGEGDLQFFPHGSAGSSSGGFVGRRRTLSGSIPPSRNSSTEWGLAPTAASASAAAGGMPHPFGAPQQDSSGGPTAWPPPASVSHAAAQRFFSGPPSRDSSASSADMVAPSGGSWTERSNSNTFGPLGSPSGARSPLLPRSTTSFSGGLGPQGAPRQGSLHGSLPHPSHIAQAVERRSASARGTAGVSASDEYPPGALRGAGAGGGAGGGAHHHHHHPHHHRPRRYPTHDVLTALQAHPAGGLAPISDTSLDSSLPTSASEMRRYLAAEFFRSREPIRAAARKQEKLDIDALDRGVQRLSMTAPATYGGGDAGGSPAAGAEAGGKEAAQPGGRGGDSGSGGGAASAAQPPSPLGPTSPAGAPAPWNSGGASSREFPAAAAALALHTGAGPATPPAAPSPTAGQVPHALTADGASRWEGINGVLADDDAISAMLTARILSKHGIKMSIAVNGRDALHMVQSMGGHAGGLRLVVTDMQMPVMTGVELCERIREWEAEDPERGRVAVYALTGNVLGEHRAICAKAGMDGYLMKPLKVSALADLAKAVGVPAPVGSGGAAGAGAGEGKGARTPPPPA